MNTIEKVIKRQKEEKNSQGQTVQQNFVQQDSIPDEKNSLLHASEDKRDLTETTGNKKENSDNLSNDQHEEFKQSQYIELDLDYLSSMGFLVPNSSNTIMNEEYRQIKRPLMRNIQGKAAHDIKNANVIQVTSSLSGEGKTFTAINLALSFAMEMDYHVLLVDADTIKSSITKTLLNTTKPGLTDYLTGEIDDLSDVMLSTNIPKLRILPAGNKNLLSTELLNSQYMGKLITEFSERYQNRVVIFDSPPILQTNDARILHQQVGQLVFVVEQNGTPQAVVKSAVELLDKDKVIGMVMNKTRTTVQGGYYGYYGY